MKTHYTELLTLALNKFPEMIEKAYAECSEKNTWYFWKQEKNPLLITVSFNIDDYKKFDCLEYFDGIEDAVNKLVERVVSELSWAENETIEEWYAEVMEHPAN